MSTSISRSASYSPTASDNNDSTNLQDTCRKGEVEDVR